MPYPATNLYPQATGLYPGDGAEVPPLATTGSATVITTTGAVFAGSIDPNGLTAHYYFEYGGGGSYTWTSGTFAAGTAPINVSRTISGLSSGSYYHYRLVAFTGAGSGYGADVSFITEYGRDDPHLSPVHDAARGQ